MCKKLLKYFKRSYQELHTSLKQTNNSMEKRYKKVYQAAETLELPVNLTTEILAKSKDFGVDNMLPEDMMEEEWWENI